LNQKNPAIPQIGFDRFIWLDWAMTALNVRAGNASLDELDRQHWLNLLGVLAKAAEYIT